MRNIKHIFVAFMLAFSWIAIAQATEIYTIDTHHSYVQWRINHLGFSNQSGKWYTEGTLILDKTKLENSKVTATINIANMVTGNEELNEHLKSSSFFDVKKFPKATFVSNKIIVTSEKTAKVQGDLTLHGITKPVTLNVMFNKQAVNPMNKKDSVGFSATTQLKRSDFDIKAYLPALADEVNLTIEVEANIKNNHTH